MDLDCKILNPIPKTQQSASASMANRLFSPSKFPPRNPNPADSATQTVLSLFNCKRRKKLKKKLSSPRVAPIQKPQGQFLPQLETILHLDSHLRFITRTASFLRRRCRPHHLLPLPAAGKLYQELGFPRGRKVSNSIARHPKLLQIENNNLKFTPLMEELVREEDEIVERMMGERVKVVRKLLMMSKERRIALAKLYRCRGIFGLPDDFRDRVEEYPEFFRVAVDEGDGKHVLELVGWDEELAVSALERDFITDEDQVRKTFKFPIPHGKSLSLDEDDERKMNSLSTLPLISPYSDGSKFDLWSLEAEKYRVGLIHEFLSLTLEKRAMIHHIVEFKEEFNLTKHTYQMLLKQPRAFYLAGTEMNWGVFLRDSYREDGTLIEKDPQVVFYEKLRKYALMKEEDSSSEKEGRIIPKK